MISQEDNTNLNELRKILSTHGSNIIGIYHDRENNIPINGFFHKRLGDFFGGFGIVKEKIAVSKDWNTSNKQFAKEILEAGFDLLTNPNGKEPDSSDKLLEDKMRLFISENKDTNFIVIISGDVWYIDLINQYKDITFLIISKFEITSSKYKNCKNVIFLDYKLVDQMNLYENTLLEVLTHDYTAIAQVGSKMSDRISNYDIKQNTGKNLSDFAKTLKDKISVLKQNNTIRLKLS